MQRNATFFFQVYCIFAQHLENSTGLESEWIFISVLKQKHLIGLVTDAWTLKAFFTQTFSRRTSAKSCFLRHKPKTSSCFRPTVVQSLLTDRSSVLPFCPNRTEQINQSSVSRTETEQNRTCKKRIKTCRSNKQMNNFKLIRCEA